jgi:hypothetical protein
MTTYGRFWVITEAGFGIEVLRRRTVERLNLRLAFLAHAHFADLVALEQALEIRESMPDHTQCASLVEAFLEICRTNPQTERGTCSLEPVGNIWSEA